MALTPSSNGALLNSNDALLLGVFLVLLGDRAVGERDEGARRIGKRKADDAHELFIEVRLQRRLLKGLVLAVADHFMRRCAARLPEKRLSQ